MPTPHSHPAAVERASKDMNRSSGIRAYSRSDHGGFAARRAHNGTVV